MFQFEGKKYDEITDIEIPSLGFRSNGIAGYFTVLPISPRVYREKYPTKARVDIEIKPEHTMFQIYDDWGVSYHLIIDNVHKADIAKLINHLKDMDLISSIKGELDV